MNQQNDQIRNFLAEIMLSEDHDLHLGDNDSLFDYGIIDSQGFMELVSWLEENYDLTIEYDEMVPENFDSIQNILEFIKRKKDAGA